MASLVQCLGLHLRSSGLLVDVALALEAGFVTGAGVALDLLDQLPRLLVCDGAADEGGLTIEVLDDFLEWGVAGLYVVPPDNEDLEGQPDIVHDVVLPVERDQ